MNSLRKLLPHTKNLLSKLATSATVKMKYIRVYQGEGAYPKDTDILARVLKKHTDHNLYKVECITPEEIVKGTLNTDTALLAIGGGYDLGLIKSLGDKGMANIKQYVNSGGSYLGICSGAYFACDRIEFDKGRPLQVVGERYLKFFPGPGIGPLFKPYDYKSRKGALAVDINFIDSSETKTFARNFTESKFKTFFNGGCYFDTTDIFSSDVEVMSHYLDLPGLPASIVKCQVESGTAVLCGPHIEYESDDINDGDSDVVDILPCLDDSASNRHTVIDSILHNLKINIYNQYQLQNLVKL